MGEEDLTEEIAKKLADFDRDPLYERRLVIFYDFLGWRNKISNAGQDPKHLGILRRRLLGRVRMEDKGQSERTTTFSDNVVKSVDVDEYVWGAIFLVGVTQVASAHRGF